MSMGTTDRNLSRGTVNGTPSSTKRRAVRYTLGPGVLIGDIYEVKKPLGHGGMGEVYLTRHIKLDIYRAVKILLPKIASGNPLFAKRFMQEARLAIQLQHPNIINVMDANYDEKLNIYYIVMELVEGSSVRVLLKKEGAFSERGTLETALCVGEALEEADRKQIVHRDIKPDNIMVTKDNKVKLADLGIAKSLDEGAGGDSLTTSNGLIGTPSYLSPEQARDAKAVDCRADIYSLGVTLYEMLAAEKPYKGASTMEILEQIFNAPVPDVRKINPNVSKATAELIMRMMSKDKNKRPRNWAVFCEEVRRIQNGLNGLKAKGAESETQATARESLSGGIVLTGSEPALQQLKDGWDKWKRTVVTVLCLLAVLLVLAVLFSGDGLQSGKRKLVLMLMDQENRELCEEFHLDPPLELAFAPETVKRTWIEQNRPVKEVKKEIIVKKRDEEDQTPDDDPEYKGNATAIFKLSAPPEVEEYLKKRGYRLKLQSRRSATMEVGFSEPVSLLAGRYKLHLSVPDCRKLPDINLDIKRDETQEISLPVIPNDGTVRINCSVPEFEVWRLDSWLKTKELTVGSLVNQDVVVRAKGYRTFTATVKLNPGETRTLNIALEPLRDTVDRSSELMQRAEAEYEKKNYATAKKLYLKAAEQGNRLANYRLGEIYEHGHGEWFSNKTRAYRYYHSAADQDYGPAFLKLGEFHENGLGNLVKSEKAALKWYRRGAELEYVPCLNRIGKFYETGMGGLDRDSNMALVYYKRGAAANDADAQYNLGRLYEQQSLTAEKQEEKDRMRQLARRWYEEAMRRGSSEARERMNNL